LDAINEKCLLDGCERPVVRAARGRPQRFCCDAHRKAHSRLNGHKKGHPDRPHRVGEKSPKSGLQAFEIQSEFRPKNRISEKPTLRFEEVNNVTWKLTNGEMTNVPASHGQWPGFRTTKALAWVINIGWVKNSSAWLARYRDQSCGPTSLAEAKAPAKAMVQGAVGDYSISHPIAHLNGLTARLIAGLEKEVENDRDQHEEDSED
jgi:hypothetical protein